MTRRSRKPPKTVPWLTIIPLRKPEMKVHASETLAKNAVVSSMYGGSISTGIHVYRWDSPTEEWVLVYDIPRGERRIPWVK